MGVQHQHFPLGFSWCWHTLCLLHHHNVMGSSYCSLYHLLVDLFPLFLLLISLLITMHRKILLLCSACHATNAWFHCLGVDHPAKLVSTLHHLVLLTFPKHSCTWCIVSTCHLSWTTLPISYCLEVCSMYPTKRIILVLKS